MDPRLLGYYNRELVHLREMGAEFASEYPKIASRLTLEGIDCADPYVERLLEGFAFLAARVHLRLDSEFSTFTQHLLEMVYPQLLAPVPSMAVVRFDPDPTEGSLKAGFTMPRGTALRSLLGKGDQTACEYRTADDVTLWPLEVEDVSYLGSPAALTSLEIGEIGKARAGIRLRLKCTGGGPMRELQLDRLVLHLSGAAGIPYLLYEQLVGRCLGAVARSATRGEGMALRLPASAVKGDGFATPQALLPYGDASFDGYRLLHEYFAFPQRFLFIAVEGLRPALAKCAGDALDLILLLSESNPTLERSISAANFVINAGTAVNLFPKRADRIHLSSSAFEYQIVPDRTAPMDFEVYDVTSMVASTTGIDEAQEFLPFYGWNDLRRLPDHQAYYAVRREPRQLSAKQRRIGPRSSYVGSEVFVSLVDGNQAPFRGDLRELAVVTRCTNRDLPLHMPLGRGDTDFTIESGAPVRSARCVAGPTRPQPPLAFKESGWRLVSHLGLNYLSLVDSDERQGAAALRELMAIYADKEDRATQKQIDGLRSIVARRVVRRIFDRGPIAVAQGQEVTVTCEEGAFEGGGAFLFGAVLERFMAKYVSINSFVETVLRSTDRGEIMRWQPRTGLRHLL